MFQIHLYSLYLLVTEDGVRLTSRSPWTEEGEICSRIDIRVLLCQVILYMMSFIQERGNVSLSVSNNSHLEFYNDSSYFPINQNFPITNFNLYVFIVNNIAVVSVNILVLIWLQECSSIRKRKVKHTDRQTHS